jgi:hypothetical protein
MELATIENLDNKNRLTKVQNPNQCVVDYIQNDKSIFKFKLSIFSFFFC